MKKTVCAILLSVVAIFGLFLFGACDDGDVSVAGKTYEAVENSVTLEFDSSVTQETKDEYTVPLTELLNATLHGSVLTFYKDGTAYMTLADGETDGHGTYTQKGNRITFSSSGVPDTYITVDGDILHCSQATGIAGITMKCDFKLKG